MKPLYATQEHVEWLGYSDRTECGSMPRWKCHVCGYQQTGARIRNCEGCGTYPAWKYNAPMHLIARTYVRHLLIRMICRMITVLKIAKNKLDDQGFE